MNHYWLLVRTRRVVIRAEAVEVDEAQIGLVEPRLIRAEAVRVTLRLCLFGRLDRNVAVLRKAGTRRDQLSDDDVFLQAHQRVGLALHGGLRENTRGLLERRGRQPRLGCEGRLGDTHDLLTRRSRLLALGEGSAVELVV